ncbi:integration host factor subunit alpha [Sphingomonas aerophila]|uniref:Integration host factor subunit alpha n=1 Tax=Sphingomonas aerophila TaxID=1344948 RepID=A0A7W9BD67_9SPHN|nr:integration host factor subunit alpha [Sphingomonas aerophila]MBB5714779.1 integration host factor subunit alpha [Sphingomonas aerophila]
MTRDDLADAIVKEHGLSRIRARRLVDQILEQMNAALGRGEDVKIANFGVFVIREKVARMGRNPKTLEPHLVSARKVLTFRPSDSMRDRIEAGRGPAR